MNMKKIIAALFSLVALSFAADVQILEPQGVDSSPYGPQILKSLLRAAVTQSGNTPVEDSTEIQLSTNIVAVNGYYLVICEQIKGGKIVNSNKQKSVSQGDLDVSIERAVVGALANLNQNTANPDLVDAAPAPAPTTASAPAPAAQPEPLPVNTSEAVVEEKPAEPQLLEKRPTRNYNSYGFGMALWHNYDFNNIRKDGDDVKGYKEKRSWDKAVAFHYARVFEASPHAAIVLLNNLNLTIGEEWQMHEVLLIGGRYYMSANSVSPYFGLGFGIGVQTDTHYEKLSEEFAFGFAGGAELGVVFFRNSAIQLELGLTWDALCDGFDFDRRFGAGSMHIAINL